MSKDSERNGFENTLPEEHLQKYNASVAGGPFYVCICCIQTLFRSYVLKCTDLHLKDTREKEMFTKWSTVYISRDNVSGYLKHAMDQYIKIQYLSLSVKNKCDYLSNQQNYNYNPERKDYWLYPCHLCKYVIYQQMVRNSTW